MADSISYRHVPAVDKAARLLAAMHDGEASGISELARRIGASKGTVRDILLTLAAHGLVTRDESGRFRVSKERPALRRLAHGALIALWRDAGETALLATVDGRDVVVTDVVESTSDPHVTARVGWRLPASVGAHGKVLAGDEPIGLDDEEYLEGVRAAAAPIVDAAGEKVAVLIVVGFKSRLPVARLRQIGRLVAARAGELSAILAEQVA
ncbi:MAG TPA: helix-turn-helix domain-containing protein [Candidatus Dormibacteraeota bacterium]|nr:helix-turn-helix domain-containing protein [Candidatus Dormibacteraeota bacterium]